MVLGGVALQVLQKVSEYPQPLVLLSWYSSYVSFNLRKNVHGDITSTSDYDLYNFIALEIAFKLTI